MTDGAPKPAGKAAGAQPPGPVPSPSLTGPQQDAAINRAGENIALRSGAGCAAGGASPAEFWSAESVADVDSESPMLPPRL